MWPMHGDEKWISNIKRKRQHKRSASKTSEESDRPEATNFGQQQEGHCVSQSQHQTSPVTCQNLGEFRWEILMHPFYSPGLAPSDYHLFLPMSND